MQINRLFSLRTVWKECWHGIFEKLGPRCQAGAGEMGEFYIPAEDERKIFTPN